MWRWWYVANMARLLVVGIAVAFAAAFAGCNYVFDIHDVEPQTTAATSGSGGAGTGGAGGSCAGSACTSKPANEIDGKRLLVFLPNNQNQPLLFDVELSLVGDVLTLKNVVARDATDHKTPVGSNFGTHVGALQCGAMALKIDDNFQGLLPAEALPQNYIFTAPVCLQISLGTIGEPGQACTGSRLCGQGQINYKAPCMTAATKHSGGTFSIQDFVETPTEVFVDCGSTPVILQ